MNTKEQKLMNIFPIINNKNKLTGNYSLELCIKKLKNMANLSLKDLSVGFGFLVLVFF